MWQGSTFGININIQDSSGNTQNLTGYSARMQMRSSYDSGTAVESMTTSNGEIVITDANLSITLDATRTANVPVDLNTSSKPPKSKYVYDLELIDTSDVVSKILYGEITVYGEVTR